MRCQLVFQTVRTHKALFIHRKIRNGIAPALQICTGMKNRVVLRPGCNDMSARPLRKSRFRCTGQRPVVALRSSGGEKDFSPVRTDRFRKNAPCLVQLRLCFLRGRIRGTGISIHALQSFRHLIQCAFSHRTGCRMIQINHNDLRRPFG